MARLGRPRSVEGRSGLYTVIPSPLLREVKLLLLDPSTGNVKYGNMSGLITSLLQDWVEKQRKEFSEQSKDEPINTGT